MVSTTVHRKQNVPGTEVSAKRNRPGQNETSSHRHKKVFICSPFHPVGETPEQRDKDWKKNIALAKQACRYAINSGYVPYAPHLYFPQFLSESDPDEREMSILLGLTWLARCDEIWVAGMRISEGMSRELDMAKEWSIPMKAYLPLPGERNRVFEAEFMTEEEFFENLAGKDNDVDDFEQEGRIYDEF